MMIDLLTISIICNASFQLPFSENWNYGSFSLNDWESSSDDWIISQNIGNPAPSALFFPQSQMNNYSHFLLSNYFDAVGMTEGKIFLVYDIRLSSMISSGTEHFVVQVWNQSTGEFHTAREYDNLQGSFNWHRDTLNIKAYAMDELFRIRFLAQGANSSTIHYWGVDNIDVYRECSSPDVSVSTELIDDTCIVLVWDPPPPPPPLPLWLHWDHGVNLASYGLTSINEFDVAARWEPEQLVGLNNAELIQIAFFPVDSSAYYSIRVWTGEGAENLILDQIVTNPFYGAWNYVLLENPVLIDTTENLWIGYHVNSFTGSPAGYDDDPAIDGYGNMINVNGTWQTLLQIDPGLNYDWNIQGYIQEASRVLTLILIYVTKDDEVIGLWNPLPNPYCVQEEGEYCFYMNAIWESATDYCESGWELIGCEQVEFTQNGEWEEERVKIFPNPTQNLVFITSKEPIFSIKIINALGQTELIFHPQKEVFSIDLSGLTGGLYFFILEMDKGIINQKIIVAK